MAANNITTIDSRKITAPLRTGDNLAIVPGAKTDIGTVYQAGFEAGYVIGHEAGMKEARAAAAAVMCAVQKNAAASAQPRVDPDRFLLGLPCRSCGAYFGSDQVNCPACKTPR